MKKTIFLLILLFLVGCLTVQEDNPETKLELTKCFAANEVLRNDRTDFDSSLNSVNKELDSCKLTLLNMTSAKPSTCTTCVRQKAKCERDLEQCWLYNSSDNCEGYVDDLEEAEDDLDDCEDDLLICEDDLEECGDDLNECEAEI